MIPTRPLAPPPGPVTLSKVLVVEGDTPMHFFEALLRHLGLQAQIEIRNFRGVGDLTVYLIDLANSAAFQGTVNSLGIVRDAEDQPAVAARQAVDTALAAAGLTPARVPPIRTSVFILPDNTNPGMIETLSMEAVRNEVALAGACACVDEFFACLLRSHIPLPADVSLAKHQAQAYRATRQEVQMFPGLAAYRGYWPWGNPVFQPLIQFLQAL